MGFLDGLKEFYFQLEDGYYALLDKIDKVIPVYKIIDPIDRILPSFPIMALLFLVALAVAANFAFTMAFQGFNTSLTVRVLDTEDIGLPNMLVSVSYSDGKTEALTTDAFGQVQLRVPKGGKVTLTVGGEGYKSQTKSVEATADEQTETIALEKSGAAAGSASTRTLRFLNELGQPITDELRVEFRCKSPYVKAPDAMVVSNGKAVVEEPAGCGQLIATISDSERWANLASVSVDSDVKTVYLEGVVAEAGRIIVNVSARGQPLSGVDVDLFRYEDLLANPEVGPVDSTVAYDGQAVFNKPQGSYLVKAYDSTGNYGLRQSERITVYAGQSATVNLELTSNVKGKIAFKIVDKATRQALAGARVTLRLAADDSEFKSLETGADGVVVFNVSDDVDYRVTVEAAGYVLEKVASARISANTPEIALEKCSAQKCGLLSVQVLDEDGSPVDNASVALYVPETNFVAGYESETSDANGLARFAGVKPGLYYAFAFREFGAGRSNDFRFGGGTTSGGGIDVTVAMQVGKGTLYVNAVNKDNKAIPFALVTVYSTLTNGKIGASYTDANGSFSIETKADKEVYVSAAKDGYSTYVSPSRKIQASGYTGFTAVLEPSIIDRPAEVKFLGLFKGERLATNLAAGEEYTGRWQLRLPDALPYKEAGLHIRTGDDLIMEKDDLYLKGVNAPGASLIKSTAFDERSGLDESGYDYTNGDAKWLNAYWRNPKPGIYELEATVQVRKTASVGDELNVYYRAWAVDGVVVRDPADDFIETTELYDNAYKQTYQVGASTLCDQDFCFDASIRNLQEDLLENVTDTYQAQVFTEYEMIFTLTNNSKALYHTNANLRVTNPDLSLIFLDYTVNDADGRPRVGNVNGPEFPRLDVGNLAPNKRITGRFRFATQRAINGVINFRLVSDQQIAFDRFINVAVAASKQLLIQLERSTLSSGIENDLVFNLVDSGTNLEVDNATCRLEDKRGNVIVKAKTDSKGRAVIRVPAQLPGVQLVLQCEKEKFDQEEAEITVTSNILEIQPNQLGMSLNAKSKPEAETGFHAKNVANFPLKVLSIELVGNFKNLLDEQQTRNWLVSNYNNYVIQPGQTLDGTLRVFLSDDGKALTDRVDLDGKFLVTVTNFGQEWVFEIPARIGIGLSGDVDSPGCLTLTRNKWETTTEGNPVNVEFQIQNNCTINGQPVPLRRLEAQLAFQGNQLGEYRVTIGQTEVELRSAYSRAIVSEVKAGETLNAILTFTPYGGTMGEAKADVSFSARNPKEDKDQLLESKLGTQINIVNIKDCVSFDRHLIAMPEKGNASFTINTKKCGGKTGFELKSDLELSVKEFVLDGDGSQQVQVFAGEEVPGQYGVVVKSKAQNEKQEQLLKNIRVRVDSIGCLALSKYEFDVLDQPKDDFDGYDTAQLTNKCIEKGVDVTVNYQDWGEAFKDGLKIGIGTFLLGTLAGVIQGKSITEAITGPECTDDKDCGQGQVCRKNHCEDKVAAKDEKTVTKDGTEYIRKPTGKWVVKSSGETVTDDFAKSLEADLAKQPASTAPTTTTSGSTAGVDPAKSAQLAKTQRSLDSDNSVTTIATFTGLSNDEIIDELAAPDGAAFLVKSGDEYFVLNANGDKLTGDIGKDAADRIVAAYNRVLAAKKAKGQTTTVNVDALLSEAGTEVAAAESAKVEAEKLLHLQTARKKLDVAAAANPSTEQQVKISEWRVKAKAIEEKMGGTQPAAQPGSTALIQESIRLYTQQITQMDNSSDNAKTKRGFYLETAQHLSDLKNNPAATDTQKKEINKLIADIGKKLDTLSAAPALSGNSRQQPSGSVGAAVAGLPATGRAAPSGGSGGSSGGVSPTDIIGTLTGAITGSKGSAVQALLATAIGTVVSYYGQGEEDMPTIQKDIEIKGFELYTGFPADKEEGVKDTEVLVSREKGDGKPVISTSRDLKNNSRTEKQQFKFTNNSTPRFTTEPENPRVKYLVVKAIEHKYADKTYDAKDFDKAKLDEEKPVPMDQKFRLQFNAVPPEARIDYKPELMNCQSGVRTGRTGPDAIPRIKLDWGWRAITANECDTDNGTAIFCDATQFSIALLQKINTLQKDFIERNTPYSCPTALEPLSTRTATIGGKDIGLSRLEAKRTGSDYNVSMEVTNNNPGEVEVQVKAYAVEVLSGKNYKCSPESLTVKVNKSTTVGCKLTGLPDGNYRVRADILPNLACPGCQNNAGSDSLEVSFSVGTNSLAQCTPYSTSRMEDFLAASGITGPTAQGFLNRIHFKANLIKDRFTADFQRDFDEYARTQSFFGAPTEYKNPVDGLYKYFRDPERFTFKPRFGQQNPEGYMLPGPGIYDVTLNITYDDARWKLFDGNKLTARIEVLLDRLDSPEPDSPFYHLPFDGPIGVSNGRVGYGVNYKGDRIKVNANPAEEAVHTVEIPGSTPVQNGVIEVFDKSNDFKRLNVDRRGTILEVSRGAINQITYSPSKATPLILKMTNRNDEAWAFYSLAIGGNAANLGPVSSKWNGIGYSCSSFDDRRMIEAFYETPDQHGLETKCALLGGEIAATSYGFEFCKPLDYGNVYLKTIYYTPQNQESKIHLNVGNDKASFIAQAGGGSDALLYGVPEVSSLLDGHQVESIGDVLKLVAKQFVCISGTDARADFWWNPKKVSDTDFMKAEELAITTATTPEKACIESK